MELVPDTVEVTGPAPAVARLQSVLTEPLQLSRLTQSTTLDLDLMRPQGGLLSYNLPQVRVRVDIQDVMISRAFQQIALTVRNTDFATELSPATIDVVVHGPQRVLEQLQLSEEEVFIDAAGHEPGTAPIAITVLVPPGVEIVSQEPQEVSLTLTNGQAARPGEEDQNAEEEPIGAPGGQ
jgi:YbbR domain-containing protein